MLNTTWVSKKNQNHKKENLRLRKTMAQNGLNIPVNARPAWKIVLRINMPNAKVVTSQIGTRLVLPVLIVQYHKIVWMQGC